MLGLSQTLPAPGTRAARQRVAAEEVDARPAHPSRSAGGSCAPRCAGPSPTTTGPIASCSCTAQHVELTARLVELSRASYRAGKRTPAGRAAPEPGAVAPAPRPGPHRAGAHLGPGAAERADEPGHRRPAGPARRAGRRPPTGACVSGGDAAIEAAPARAGGGRRQRPPERGGAGPGPARAPLAQRHRGRRLHVHAADGGCPTATAPW